MSLADTIRGALAIADGITKSLQVDVTHQAWIGQDRFGTDAFAAPVSRKAIVIQERKQVQSSSGVLMMTKAYVAFLFPVPYTTPNAGQIRLNPIDTRDGLTLPDGTTGPIVLGGGLLDGGTGKPYYNEVYLGDMSSNTGA